jgi:hypothetical protein
VSNNSELNLHNNHEWEFYWGKADDVVTVDGTGNGSGILNRNEMCTDRKFWSVLYEMSAPH